MYRPAAIRHSGSLRWKWHCREARIGWGGGRGATALPLGASRAAR
jgi:hypothetical protein